MEIIIKYILNGQKKTYKFLCQKNLLIEGSIVDFEKMFFDKIIKK